MNPGSIPLCQALNFQNVSVAGAKKLVLTSRSGVKSGYQAHCISRWQSQGVEITVSKRDVCQKDEAMKLIEEALERGPVGGVFNLAMVRISMQLFSADDKFTFFINFRIPCPYLESA